MLNYVFGFNARMGRLAFFFCSIVVGFGFVMLAYGITGNVPTSSRMDVLLAQATNSFPLKIAFYGVFVICFMLQSMRVRDIGWDPVCVMPGWFVVMIFDKLLATKFPALALTAEHNSTVVGALVNLGLGLALTFWPSGDAESSSDSEPHPKSDAPWGGRNAPPATANRIARVSSGEFGGRAG